MPSMNVLMLFDVQLRLMVLACQDTLFFTSDNLRNKLSGIDALRSLDADRSDDNLSGRADLNFNFFGHDSLLSQVVCNL